MSGFLVSLKAKLQHWLAFEPAAITWAVNGGVASVVAFLLPLFGVPVSPVALASITTITTAASAAYVALKARPVVVSIATGSLATILTAVAGFGLHLDPHLIATAVDVTGTVLGLLFRQNLTPAVKAEAKSVA